jgi:iron complex outermembrane receptor protein
MGARSTGQLISGVNWSYQSIFLPDVHRIEVLRGPGGTLWGANAVNGVINVVTKSAHDTLGSFAQVGYGIDTASVVSLRHGWKINQNIATRVYAQVHDHDGDVPTGDTINGWTNILVGTRSDWYRADGGSLSLIAEFRDMKVDDNTPLPSVIPPYYYVPVEEETKRGGNLVLRWQQPLGANSELSFQTSYSREDAQATDQISTNDIFEADLQITMRPIKGHEVLLGATTRMDSDSVENTPWVELADTEAITRFYGAFIQDEMRFFSDRFRVTVGTKIERNSFTGWELQPALRLLWHVAPEHTLWASVSRGARIPSRAERGVDFLAAVEPPNVQQPIPAVITANGSETFKREQITAYEAGYRVDYDFGVRVDLAVFHNEYSDLRGIYPQDNGVVLDPVPYYENLFLAMNGVWGQTTGAELEVTWDVSSSWRLIGSVNGMSYDLKSVSPFELGIPGLTSSSPHFEAKLRSSWDFAYGLSFDAMLRYSEGLENKPVPARTALDLRLGWKIDDAWSIDLIGRDLFDKTHAEITKVYLDPNAQEVSRSWMIRVNWSR